MHLDEDFAHAGFGNLDGDGLEHLGPPSSSWLMACIVLFMSSPYSEVMVRKVRMPPSQLWAS